MIDNMMTRVKVNNEIDLCEIIAPKARKVEEIRHRIEAALQYARVSYFLRWQEPNFFARVFMREHPKLIFEELQLTEQDVRMLGNKSKNKY